MDVHGTEHIFNYGEDTSVEVDRWGSSGCLGAQGRRALPLHSSLYSAITIIIARISTQRTGYPEYGVLQRPITSPLICGTLPPNNQAHHPSDLKIPKWLVQPPVDPQIRRVARPRPPHIKPSLAWVGLGRYR
jgi:hypothetical protein